MWMCRAESTFVLCVHKIERCLILLNFAREQHVVLGLHMG